jgi:hypothetical protein
VPVLVTNAELVVLESGCIATTLERGTIESPPESRLIDVLILKHPFPTPDGMGRDFREHANPPPSVEDWSQLDKESIYVVRPSALRAFMSETHRGHLRSARTKIRSPRSTEFG